MNVMMANPLHVMITHGNQFDSIIPRRILTQYFFPNVHNFRETCNTIDYLLRLCYDDLCAMTTRCVQVLEEQID